MFLTVGDIINVVPATLFLFKKAKIDSFLCYISLLQISTWQESNMTDLTVMYAISDDGLQYVDCNMQEQHCLVTV